MGVSISKSESEQNAEVQLTQIYKGTCDITCQNIEENITVDLINSVVGGGIVFSQSCTSNANCIFGNTMDATSDVIFKATNSSNAKNAWDGWSLGIGNIDVAESKSRQNIRESITEASTQKCKLSSYNQMNNITIFSANSQIGGGIEFRQKGDTQGKCVLDNNMSAAAYASGMAQNTAKSGKDKKASKFGDKSALFRLLVYVGIGLVTLVVTIIIGKVITSSMSRKKAAITPGVSRVRRTPPVRCPEGSKLRFNPADRMFSCVETPGATRIRPSIVSRAE